MGRVLQFPNQRERERRFLESRKLKKGPEIISAYDIGGHGDGAFDCIFAKHGDELTLLAERFFLDGTSTIHDPYGLFGGEEPILFEDTEESINAGFEREARRVRNELGKKAEDLFRDPCPSDDGA